MKNNDCIRDTVWTVTPTAKRRPWNLYCATWTVGRNHNGSRRSIIKFYYTRCCSSSTFCSFRTEDFHVNISWGTEQLCVCVCVCVCRGVQLCYFVMRRLTELVGKSVLETIEYSIVIEYRFCVFIYSLFFNTGKNRPMSYTHYYSLLQTILYNSQFLWAYLPQDVSFIALYLAFVGFQFVVLCVCCLLYTSRCV